MNSRYFPQLLMVIINSDIVLALINDKCNLKLGRSMVAHRCQSKKIKITKIKHKIKKNENKKKVTKILFRKKPDKVIMSRECKI